MSREEFMAIVERVAEYFPPEDVVVAAWNKFKIMDADAVLTKLRRTQQYKTHFPIIRPVIARSIADVSDAQMGKDILALIDTYYPSIITEIDECDKCGNKKPGDLLVDIIRKMLAEVR